MLDAKSDISRKKALDDPIRINKSDYIITANKECGAIEWFKKWLGCAKGPGKLSLDEFLFYGLFRSSMSYEDCRRYIGKKRQNKFHLRYNNSTWYAPAHDKALFYTTVKGAGFSVPDTICVHSPKKRSGFKHSTSDRDQLIAFLKANDAWPLFAKPIGGMYSIGTMVLGGMQNDALIINGRREEKIDDFFNYISKLSNEGYIFQSIVRPHEYFIENFADVVATVRFLVFFSDVMPEIESVVLKIPSGGNTADNFWRNGNMLAAVDKASGSIERVILNGEDGFRELQRHPDTGLEFSALYIPDWEHTCEVVRCAASLFPEVRTQSWDVAISNDGPILMEFNFGGDLNLHQIAHARGALTENYKEHLRRCGHKGKLD